MRKLTIEEIKALPQRSTAHVIIKRDGRTVVDGVCPVHLVLRAGRNVQKYGRVAMIAVMGGLTEVPSSVPEFSDHAFQRDGRIVADSGRSVYELELYVD